MAVRVQCPNPKCGKSYRVDDSRLGRTGVCKYCGNKFTLSASDAKATGPGDASETPVAGGSPDPPTPKTASASPFPKQLGRFEIRQRLGAGAFGTVYRAYDPTLERDVALKVPQPAVLERPKARARFLREPKAAAQLQHPHIVPVFEAGAVGERYYIASAFIEGRTLSDLIEEDPPDLRRSVQIVHDLADALHYAHQMGVVHRDVKPGNVMINADGQAMLMDFGLARLEDSQEKLTQDGAVMGTPAYMAPEQAGSSFGPVGPASDQYSLGVVLYELLCGQTPFSGTPSILIYNTLHREPEPPRKVRRSVPRDLETICLRAMAKEPSQRYADCGQLAADLERWSKDEPILARPIGAGERLARWCRRRPALAATLAAAAVLAAVVAVLGVRYVKTSSQLDRQAAQRREAQQQRQLAEQEKDEAQRAREAVETRLLQTQAALDKALAALHEAEAALAAAKTDAEREAAEKRLEEARKQVAAAQNQQEEAEWEQALAETPAPSEEAKPTPEKLMLPPLEPPKNPPMSGLALVSRPAPLPGVKSWSIETRAQRGCVTALTYSPDGRRLATAGPDGAIRIWSAPGGELQSILLGHTGFIHDLAWSARAKMLASAGADGAVRLWDTASGRLVRTLGSVPPRSTAPSVSAVLSVAWSPHGTQLAVATEDQISFYNAATGETVETVSAKSVGVASSRWVAWSPDGKTAAWSGKALPGATCLLDAGSGRALRKLLGAAAAWSPDGEVLACATRQPVNVHFYEAATGTLIRTVPNIGRDVWETAWSPTGRALAVATGDKVHVLDPAGDQSWSIHSAGTRIAWSPDGRTLACASRAADQGDIHFVDVAQRKIRKSARGHRTGVTSVAWSHGGRFLASGSFGGDIQIWDTAGRRRLRTINEGKEHVSDVAWSPDDRWLAASLHAFDKGEDDDSFNLCVLHLTARGAPRRILRGHLLPVLSVSWSPNGAALASGGDDRSVRLWDLASGKETAQFHGKSANEYVAWSPDGKTVAARFRDPGEVLVWDVAAGRVGATLNVSPVYGGLAWSPHGKTLAYDADWEEIALWAPTGQAAARTIDSPFGRHLTLQWSPDGAILAALRPSPTMLALLHSDSGKLLRCFPSNNCEILPGPHFYYPHTISWSPGGATLATGSVDGSIGLWDVAAGYPRTVLVGLRANQWLAVSSDGYWKGSPGVEKELVYVVQTDEGQQTLSPAQFAQRYHWRNDPRKVAAGGE